MPPSLCDLGGMFEGDIAQLKVSDFLEVMHRFPQVPPTLPHTHSFLNPTTTKVKQI